MHKAPTNVKCVLPNNFVNSEVKVFKRHKSEIQTYINNKQKVIKTEIQNLDKELDKRNPNIPLYYITRNLDHMKRELLKVSHVNAFEQHAKSMIMQVASLSMDVYVLQDRFTGTVEWLQQTSGCTAKNAKDTLITVDNTIADAYGWGNGASLNN